MSLCFNSFLLLYGGKTSWLKQVWDIGSLKCYSELCQRKWMIRKCKRICKMLQKLTCISLSEMSDGTSHCINTYLRKWVLCKLNHWNAESTKVFNGKYYNMIRLLLLEGFDKNLQYLPDRKSLSKLLSPNANRIIQSRDGGHFLGNSAWKWLSMEV